MIVDAHGHVGTALKFYSIRITSVEDLIKEIDKYGVDKIVVSDLKSIQYDCKEGNAELKKDWDKYPDRIIPLCTVHARYYDDVQDLIDLYIGEYGFKGIKLHPELHSYPANCRAVYQVFEKVSEFDVPVKFHSGDPYVGGFCKPQYIGEIAGAFPEITVIMAHMGVSDWLEGIEVAIEHPNIILDTTGATINYGMVEFAVEMVGAERIIWGSDTPLYTIISGLSKVTDGGLSEDAKEKVLSENALRIFNEVA